MPFAIGIKGMTNYEKYVLFLCLIVFVLLTVVTVLTLSHIIKLTVRIIQEGVEDERIKKEYKNSLKKKKKKCGIVECILFLPFCVIFCIIFAFALYANIRKDVYSETVPTLTVVQSGSMAEKHKDNDYLWENNLNNQVQTFDLILLYKVPKEEDLKLYDIVAYQVDGILVLHRIVGIEEPNETHPDERYFLIQGDAVGKPDRFPVEYEQIKAIYRNQRIPFVGSFVSFMQSPAGWLCLALVLFAIIATPAISKKLKGETDERLIILGEKDEEVEDEWD